MFELLRNTIGVELMERYWCVYCVFDMNALGMCIDCNEYKSAVTFEEYVEMNGVEPKVFA